MKKQLKRVRKGIYLKKPSYIREVIKRKKQLAKVISWSDLTITLGGTSFGAGEIIPLHDDEYDTTFNRFNATNELAWRKDAFSRFGDNKVLVQKWVDVFNGTEHWREVKTLN